MSLHSDIVFLERLAKLLDNQFKIGPFRFGLDPLLGLVPVLGDILPLAFSAVIIITAKRHDVDQKIIRQMIFYTFADFIVGTTPVIGDIGDFFFKANIKNLELLKKHAPLDAVTK